MMDGNCKQDVSLEAFELLKTPVWVYDLERSQVHWANSAAIRLWNADSLEELRNQDFSHQSESTRTRNQHYLQQLKQGKTLVERWTFHPKGQPVSIRCTCSAMAIEQGRLAMLVEGIVELPHEIDQDTLRSTEALRHTSVMISLYSRSGVPLLQNPAALHCYGDVPQSSLGSENVFLQRFANAAIGQQVLTVLETGESCSIETQVLTQKGLRWHSIDAHCVNDPVTGDAMILVNEKDITAQQIALSSRLQAKAELEAQRAFLNQIIDAVPSAVFVKDREGRLLVVNQAATHLHDSTVEAMLGKRETEYNPNFDVAQLEAFLAANQQVMQGRQTWQQVQQIVTAAGERRWYQTVIRPWIDQSSQVQGIIGNSIDITELKQAEEKLRHQAERERMISTIAQHIRRSLDLDAILETTVTEVRRFLQCDRVIIYRSSQDWCGMVVTESVAPPWNSILHRLIPDSYFVKNSFVENSQQSFLQDVEERMASHRGIQVRKNIYEAGLSHSHIEFLETLQVKAELVVPICQGDTLWGLLVAHQCDAPRSWQSLEIELVFQLTTQVAIAIQQSELYHQVQHLNTHLEFQVQERTAQLQQALNFEALLKRITDKVRDSLDEAEILRSAVQELAQELQTYCCDTGIYSADQTTARIAYEFSPFLPPVQDRTCSIPESTYSEVYQCLLQGQVCQFCNLVANALRPEQPPLSILACPIKDDQGVLGDLWLFKLAESEFSDQAVRLVQQVATQCAIALRQSRLYHAAQAQVEELARLNQLKDDFLNTVSHELRTPIANMTMAIRMLDISLRPLGIFEPKTSDAETDNPETNNPETNRISAYFQILQTECQREMGLINDLLDLARLDSDPSPLSLCPVYLQFWISHLVEPFVQRAYDQAQHLKISIPEDLPPLATDLAYLERALTELLHNAFKYTPSGETIAISARLSTDDRPNLSPHLLIEISNSGVEIPAIERDRVFDKFYRIPNGDPWKHGGTGLGLSLVKKLVERLGGAIWVESGDRLTRFILQFPLNP